MRWGERAAGRVDDTRQALLQQLQALQDPATLAEEQVSDPAAEAHDDPWEYDPSGEEVHGRPSRWPTFPASRLDQRRFHYTQCKRVLSIWSTYFGILWRSHRMAARTWGILDFR